MLDAHGPGAVAGLGGARSSNEEAFAFQRLLRETIGTGNLDARLGDALDTALLAAGPARGLIGDLETAASVLVWGPDLKEELPVLYLRVRRAVDELGATLVVVHPRRTGLDSIATEIIRYRPGSGADVLAGLRAGTGEFAAAAAALTEGPVVAIVGRTGLAESPDLAGAVAEWAATLAGASVLPVTRRPNLYGAIDMGVAPDLAPGRVPVDAGLDADAIVAGLGDSVKALILLGADPIGDHPAAPSGSADFTVSIDMFLTSRRKAG